MLITLARITNYKRIKDIEIRPDADNHLILIGGQNAQGKTSMLDALDAAIGGKGRIADAPVHRGMARAAITIENDRGALVVERIIEPDGETTLKVTGKDGSVRSPQTMLDQLLGARFIDPLAFLRLAPKDQRAALLRLIDGKGELAELEVRRDRIFEKRTEVGRDLKKAEGELARLPPIAEVGEPIDVAALSQERSDLALLQRANDALVHSRDSNKLDADRASADAERTRARIVELTAELKKLHDHLPEILGVEAELRKKAAHYHVEFDKAAANWVELLPRREQIDAQLAKANQHNAAAFAAENAAKRRSETADAIDKLVGLRTKQTQMLDKIEEQKVAFLAAAKLPIEGLGVETEGITLNAVPFDQASGAERLRVAVSLAMASASELDDILIRDAALLDDEMMGLVGQLAESAGKRVWLERVGTRDPGAIVIADGMVAE